MWATPLRIRIVTDVTLKLIDPNNNKPFYPYNGSIIDGDDVDDMKDAQNYLRIMCRNADFAESDLGIVNHLKETPMVL